MSLKINLSAAIISCALVAGIATDAEAHTVDYYTQQSAMSRGTWVKVKISRTGIHQITYSQLEQMGFSDPSKVKVCGYGGTLLSTQQFTTDYPDDLKETPSVHTADGRLLFYGQADVDAVVSNVTDDGRYAYSLLRNYYSFDTWYMLTDSDVPAAHTQVAYNATDENSVVDTHLDVELYEPEEQNPGLGSAVYHSRPFSGGEEAKFTFPVRDFAGSATQPAWLQILTGVNETTRMSTYTMPLSFSASLKAVYADETMAMSNAARDIRYNAGTGEYCFVADSEDTEVIPDGDYDFGVRFPASNNLSYAAFDRAVLVYPRRNIMRGQQGGLRMQIAQLSQGDVVNIASATAGTMVFNVSNNGIVYPHETHFDPETSTLSFTADRQYNASDGAGTGIFVAFDPEQEQIPVEEFRTLANQDLHSHGNVAMLIITTDELYDAACQLAEMHRKHNGMDVAVFTQNQIFNEFSSGTPTIMAYRRAAKMFYDRDPFKFKYVLLYGAGSFDNRGLVVHSNYERLLVFENEPVAGVLESMTRHSNLNFATDDVMGMLRDGYDPSYIYSTQLDVAVGRLPVESPAQGMDVNSKIENYMTSGGDVQTYSRVLLISDDGDANQHLHQSQELGTEMLRHNPALTCIQAHNSIYPRPHTNAAEARRLVKKSLVEGVGYFSYTGHGRPTYLTAESIWSQNDVTNTRYTHQPLVTIASCDTYQLDRNQLGIAEQMVMMKDGGAIAAVAACRSVYLDYNQHINLAMAVEYASVTEGSTVGDVYRRAHNAAIKTAPSPSGQLNTLCYNLCGDPALRLPSPSLQAFLTTVNGRGMVPNTGEEPDTVALKPMEYLEFAGKVAYALDGNADETFNGKATVTLYDAAHDVPVIVLTTGSSGDYEEDITLDENMLATTTVDVANGNFTGRILVPYPAYQGINNRVVMGATEMGVETNPRFALGVCDRVRLEAAGDATFEGSLPEITEFYINTPEFVDGDVVDSQFTVNALVKVGDGGLSKTSAIGGAGKLLLDGNTSVDGANNAMVINYDGTASMILPMSDVQDGRHTLTLTVADNAGNRVSRMLAFTVVNNPVQTGLTVEEKTAREYATLNFEHGFTGDEAVETRLVIRDEDGATVHSVANPVFPYRWNLKDADGASVADGRYTAFVTSRSGHNYSHTTSAQIVVVK